MKLKQQIAISVAAVAALVAPLEGQDVRFKGSATGCFFTTTADCAPADAATTFFLTYTGGSFDAYTAPDGSLSLGTPNGNPNNLGLFALGTQAHNYGLDGTSFLLRVLFELPTLTSSNIVYSAALIGSVSASGLGGIKIDFDNSVSEFAFDGPDRSGIFTLQVADLTVGAGSTRTVAANIETITNPEPATLVLLGTGLAGILPVVRRKRRSL